MAEIPVERKGGVPWWVWLLGALLLLALLALLSRGCDTTDTTNANRNVNAVGTTTNTNNANNTNRNATGAINNVTNSGVGGVNSNNTSNVNGGGGASGATITDVNVYGTTTDKATLDGRGVTLQNVKVERVLSDRVFTVKSGSSEIFALLADSLDSPGGKESQIKARPGQMVNLSGTFRRPPSASLEVADDRKDGSLNQKEFKQMEGQQVYLQVTEARNANQ